MDKKNGNADIAPPSKATNQHPTINGQSPPITESNGNDATIDAKTKPEQRKYYHDIGRSRTNTKLGVSLKTSISTSTGARSTSPSTSIRTPPRMTNGEKNMDNLESTLDIPEDNAVIFQPDHEIQSTEVVGPEKEDLTMKSHTEPKKMFTNPQLRDLYGDNLLTLLTATWKANFKRMTLDLHHSIDRNLVPGKFRFLMDEVSESMTNEENFAALDAVVDDAHYKYNPHLGLSDQEVVEGWREVEYRGGRQVV